MADILTPTSIAAGAGEKPSPNGASAIWEFDSKTLELTRKSLLWSAANKHGDAYPLAAKWTNLNGSSLTPTIGWHKESNLLFFIGNDSVIDGKENVAVVRGNPHSLC